MTENKCMKEDIQQKQFEDAARELMDFIKKSPTSFHAAHNIAELLEAAGATRLYEHQSWENALKIISGANENAKDDNLGISKGAKTSGCARMFYVMRGDSAVIAFKIPEGIGSGANLLNAINFQIVSSHSDSPCFKIKENPEMAKCDHYIELNVEKYGGALLHPWFDRPLSVAGRVLVDDGNKITTKLIDFDRDLCMIPSLAIHLNREANEGGKIDVQKTMMPVIGDESAKGDFARKVAELAGAEPCQVVGSDLFLYNRVQPTVWGMENELFSAGRIDDLMCAFGSVKAYIDGENKSSVTMCAVFDNEEVGSMSKAGADSDFLAKVLERVSALVWEIECNQNANVDGVTGCKDFYRAMCARSFMVSADNGHAIHPNYAEKSDPTNQPYMNGGVVIKYNAAQKYTTDGVSGAIFKKICNMAQVPVQTYVNNSNVPGGSTLGNIANTHVTMNTVDIGAAQLAMHSPYESAGVKDVYYLEKAMEAFYNTAIRICEDGYEID